MARRRFKRRRFSRRRKFRRSRRARVNRRTGGLLGLEKKYQDCTNLTHAVLSGSAWTQVRFSGTGSHGTFPALTPNITAGYLGAATPWNAIPLQDGPNGRENRKVSLQSLLVEGSVYFPGSHTTLSSGDSPFLCGTVNCVLAFVLDTQCNGSVPNANDIWQLAPLEIGSTAPTYLSQLMTPQRNMANTDRFKVLKFLRFQYIPEWDSVSTTTAGAVTDAKEWMYMGCRQYFKFKLNLKGLITSFSPTATTPVVGAIRDNAIWGFAWGYNDWDVTYATETYVMAPSFSLTTRLRFYG